ncbi:MAG: hypothetical protein JNM34_08365 [Chthonomonadaceae bacterium]|nr:hypothetical protein [Chthonomonadaceae bacterium]
MSLFEAMISLVLVVAAVGAVFGVAGQSARVGRQSEARAVAASIARQKLDELASMSFANRPVVDGKVFPISNEILLQFPETVRDQVTGRYSVTAVAGAKNLHQLSVTVSWKSLAALSSTDSFLTMTRIVSSYQDVNSTGFTGEDPISDDYIFYDPPATSGGSGGDSGGTSGTDTGATTGGGSDGGSTGTDTGGTTGSDTGSDTTGGDPGSTGSDTGGGTTSSDSGGTDGGGTTGGTSGGFGGDYGDKWG